MWVFLNLQNSAIPLGFRVTIMPLIVDGPHPTEKNGTGSEPLVSNLILSSKAI